jgi:hypothetical protein
MLAVESSFQEPDQADILILCTSALISRVRVRVRFRARERVGVRVRFRVRERVRKRVWIR